MKRGVVVVLTWSVLLCSCPVLGAVVTSVRLQLPPGAGPVVQNIGQLFARQVSQRCEAEVHTTGESGFTVELAVEPGFGAEGYAISSGPDGSVRIIGNDELGLLYGVGKFLRTSRYDPGGFTPGKWRGRSVPQCPFRAIYAATHFMNYYEAAPTEEVQRYVEELGLWGANTLILHFPTWQFQSFDDPAAKKSLERICRMLRAGKNIGMRTGLVQCPNQGWAGAPPSVRAAKFPDDLGRRGNHGINCCPSKTEGREYLTKLYGRLFDECREIGLDYLVCWPYDEGGCGCADCWPWGAKGCPRLAHDVVLLARKRYPQLKAILSTWCYDTPPAGEWEGLAKLLQHDKTWLASIMADSHEDFPRYPLEVGTPGGLPLLNFPEISMWGRGPWGGYGANPLPARFERLWKQTQGRLSGGMLYSEGIYEDINKAICLQFYWDKQRSAERTLREYIAFEYSPRVAGDLSKAVHLLEATWAGTRVGVQNIEALEFIRLAERQLTPQAKAGWRWRILLLRAVIDDAIHKNCGKLEGTTLRDSFNELRHIYHAENALPAVCPPILGTKAL